MNLFNYATINVITVSPSVSIDHAISLMEEHEMHHLVVAREGRVVGIVSDRDILISTGWMLSGERRVGGSVSSKSVVTGPSTVEEIMSAPPRCIQMHETASDAASIMVERKISALPIVNMGRLMGILTDSDLLKWLEALGTAQLGATRFLAQPLESLMRVNLVTATPETLLTDVTELFRKHRVRHLPVLDQGLLVGIISDRDVRRSIGWSEVRESQFEDQSGSVALSHSTARDIMQTTVHWVRQTCNLGDCLRLMLTKHVHSVPVLDAGRLVGIITHTDFVKAIAHQELL